ncbi:MAG: hypothetical protein HYZ75_11825 [Elusimicrobia bacterium]|nr:hypothetical protein [Elusimicrobiota bacterium]
MTTRTAWTRVLAVSALALASAAPAAAKIVFTGYGAFNFTTDGAFRVHGPPAVIGTLPEGTTRLRGFSTDAVGLFAATKAGEDSEFLVDLNFRNVGAAVGETRIQYAYLDTALPWDMRLQAGKITLPIGYYNTRFFYPFQRVSISGPVFQSGILGLPIADVGAVVSRHFEEGDWGVDLRVYGVNGYGSTPNSTATFRSPSAPGGLTVSRNLGAGNNNRDLAVGGQAAIGARGLGEAGMSYYRGAWDKSGERVLQILGAHVLFTPARLNILAEYLHLDVDADQGMAASLGGNGDWHTDGLFIDVSHPLGAPRGMPLTGFARGEIYDSSSDSGGGGHESLRSLSTGAALRVNDSITWKAECLWLEYRVPFVSAKSIVLVGHSVSLGLVAAF